MAQIKWMGNSIRRLSVGDFDLLGATGSERGYDFEHNVPVEVPDNIREALLNLGGFVDVPHESLENASDSLEPGQQAENVVVITEGGEGDVDPDAQVDGQEPPAEKPAKTSKSKS